MRHVIGVLGLAMAAAMLPSGAALADAIDGDWCFDDGRQFSIRGPAIITPGGTEMAGNYSRHAFSYVVPVAEPDSGAVVSMTLVNDTTVHLKVAAGAESGPLEVWRRCAATVS